ncbi:branched-chain-amino-acid transaminase [Actinomadura madurae]|uniref:branched-chain-amino-acid transaminase n=1 Tax=Actinomadura madurae TaxID=1993 RepID=UPI0020D260BB|nr:branched-chain-amino-acid transaminase [Actinomadura madurae]MCP9953864.1 branched-chain-amino-acid transaminase [Actinomadura madurae]MCP9970613.1 branched-chain-amino-acid transaminase [Actinomadura madurae]MCP9983085.1 branched-chain-amino-acid transaminase [Actinomadura madurae]MCQ0005357.1 branched-chain-amino-acid transaminase [Actinomadura madurae]MCQ0019331.1 branched-chain-amino-acid transaminase [Actinomadura madurae]
MNADERIAYAGGEFVPESQASVSILDHAVLYGDGVFETVVAWEGRIFKLDAHVRRFLKSCAAVALDCPVTENHLKDLIVETVRRNNLQNAYIKWILTRGSNGTPLMDPTGCVPNLIIMARPYIDRSSQAGLRVKTVAVRRPPGQVLDAHVKSLNYLNLVMAKIEAKAAGADQALMLDVHGRLCEAPGFNIFVVTDEVLKTPQHDILRGITRETTMELATEKGLQVHQTDLELYDAYTADELFLTSTAGGLVPVVEVDGRPIGTGKPGPTLATLQTAYQEVLSTTRWSTPVT